MLFSKESVENNRERKKKLYCLSIQREREWQAYIQRKYHTRRSRVSQPEPDAREPSALTHQFRKLRKPPGQTPSQRREGTGCNIGLEITLRKE
jgi:hypothetical protein